MRMFWPPWRCWTSPSWRPWTTPNGWVLPPAPHVSQAQGECCTSCINKAHKSESSSSSLAVLGPPALQTTQPLGPSGGIWNAWVVVSITERAFGTSYYRAALKSASTLEGNLLCKYSCHVWSCYNRNWRAVCLKDCRGIMQAPQLRRIDLVYMCKKILHVIVILDYYRQHTDQEAYWSSFINTYKIWADIPYKHLYWEVHHSFVVLPGWKKC